jgi:hypothetical protein
MAHAVSGTLTRQMEAEVGGLTTKDSQGYMATSQCAMAGYISSSATLKRHLLSLVGQSVFALSFVVMHDM